MTEYAVEINSLSFGYKNYPAIIVDELKVPKGEFLTLIGPNGGGKSTLLKLMLGLLKPDKGYIKVLGQNPAKLSGQVGYVPQYSTGAQGFPITVEQSILISREKTLGKSPDNIAKVHSILESFDILNLKDKKLDELSGGQRQRVYTARAIAIEPTLLILDEPASNIDSGGQKKLFDILKELNKTITVFVVSHDISIIPQYSTSVACVNKDVHYHNEAVLTPEIIQSAYGDIKKGCPVEFVAHGVPHRVLTPHCGDKHCKGCDHD